MSDKILDVIVNELVSVYGCHTVVLYGSRARGTASLKSDYDVVGIRRSGKRLRLAEYRKGYYLDAFIFPEKDLTSLGEGHLYMRDARILHQADNYGASFIKRLNVALKRRYKPLPNDEIKTRQIWAHKMLERIAQGDVEALYRRSWLHTALLEDYFTIRKMRYGGSKFAFDWLKEHDRKTFNKFYNVLMDPGNLVKLRSLVEAVSMLKRKDITTSID